MAKAQSPDQLALSDPALLEKIDSLFACNVGEYISLPQLVVVGDQSSGKSSVLEGLTQLPFPRDSGLCTRFATQIIFRRSKEHSTRTITASVLAGPDASPEKAAVLEEWTWSKVGTFDPSEFSAVMNEVHVLMGVSIEPNHAKPTFSNDVFRLEICGPDEDHLSVIDVPGIFKNTVPGVTSKVDIQLVHNMVVGYMKNPRSIMLMVVPANVDIATQEVVELAREHDPDGQRTLGVLTKPDLVDMGAEHRVLDIIRGEDLTFRHGWFLVRNLGQRELQEGGVDRNAAEDAFRQKEPWNAVPQDRFGIHSLRLRLQEAVIHNARQSFSQVRSEIMKRLKSRQQSLKDLGNERTTSEQQRSFLLGVVSRFQEIAFYGLNSNYAMDDVFANNPDLRIATLIMNCHVAFADNLSIWAHEYQFGSDDTNNAELKHVIGAPSSTSRDEQPSNESDSTPSIKTRMTEDLEELTEVLHESTKERSAKTKGIYQWLTQGFRLSRGFEMGTFNPSILAEAFRKQSAKWPNFALGYISDIITLIHRFIIKALEISSVDQRVCSRLKARVITDLLSKYRDAVKQVCFLLHIERNGTPLTLNNYFNDSLHERRTGRVQAQLASKVFRDYNRGDMVRLSDITTAQHISNTRQTVEDIHDILESYYKAALKRFVDNVCMQAADFCLVRGPDTPTKLFNSLFVHNLSVEELEEIAGEELHVRRLRTQLIKEIRDLEAGKRILL